jgi:hypothetical protein
MSRTEAEDFIHSWEIGQTEKGSYTVTLRAPVGLHELSAEGNVPGEVPFARKATETLAASVAQIAQAIDQDRIENVLDRPPEACG